MADLYGNIPISDEPAKKRLPGRKEKDGPRRKPPGKPPREKSLLQRWYIVTPIILILLFAGYYIGSSVLVPQFIEKKFPEIFQENTGLHLRASSSVFNPLNCSLRVADIHINEITGNDVTEDLLFINDLFVDLDFISLLRNGIVSNVLNIQDATLTIVRHPDNTYNISKFFTKSYDSGMTSGVMNFADLPFLYSLNNISITDSSILFKDSTTDKVHQVKNLNLNLPTLSNFSFDAGTYIPPRFSAIINGSPIELVGQAETPDKGSDANEPTKLSCTIKSIDLPLYAGYLPMPLPIDIDEGKADGTVQISFQSEKDSGRQLGFDYKLRVENIQLSSHDKTLTLTAPLVNLEGSLDPLKSDIEIANLFVRDPTLIVKKGVSPATIDSLFLEHYSKNTTTNVPLELPSLRITLLIADNGRVVFEADKENKTFSPVQLSLRNFANSRALLHHKKPQKSYFRISGESEGEFAHFSWQGGFEQTTPVGNLEIINLPFTRVLHLISPESKAQGQGNGTVRGRLSFTRSDKKPLSLKFDQGTAQFSKISIAEGATKWLQSASASLSSVALADGKVDLGNIFLENGEISLSRDNLPPLLQYVQSSQELSLNGLDLKGSITLESGDSKSPPLQLEKVHLQLTNQENKESNKNNFTLSAVTVDNGSIKAKGDLRLKPLQGKIETSFANMPAMALFGKAGIAQLSGTNNILISGTGVFRAESKRFDGALEIGGGTLKSENAQTTYRFKKAAIASLSTDMNLSDISGEKLLVDDFAVDSDTFQFQAGGTLVSAFTRKENDLTLDKVVFTQSELTTLSPLSSATQPLLTKGSGKLTVKDLRIAGKAFSKGPDQEKTALFTDFSLAIKPLSTNNSPEDNLTFKAIMADQGKISATGSLSIYPLQTALDLKLAKVKSHALAPLTAIISNDFLRADITGALHYTFPQSTLSGSVELDQGSLHARDGGNLASWEHGILSRFQYSKEPRRLSIDKITLDQPRIAYSNDGESLAKLIKEKINEHFPLHNGDKGAVTFSQFAVPRIDIHNGVLEYNDARMVPPWRINVTDLSGFIKNYNMFDSDEPLEYTIRGNTAGGQLSAQGSMVQRSDAFFDKGILELQHFPLATLEQQLSEAFPVKVQDSLLDLHYQNNGKDNSASATFSVSSLSVTRQQSATAMTIALLSNKKDQFSQTVSLPKENKSLYFQLVSYLQKLLVKSSVSPYLLLPSPYNGLRQNRTISFAPGTSELNAPERANLDLHGLLLSDFPLLRLDLTSLVDRPADSAALREKLEKNERERVRRENARLLTEWQENNSDNATPAAPPDSIIVEDITETDLQTFTPVSMRPIIITEAMLTELGRERLLKIKQFLLDKHAVPEENIKLFDTVQKSEQGTTPQVQIELGHIDIN